jgi:hypothetical protein
VREFDQLAYDHLDRLESLEGLVYFSQKQIKQEWKVKDVIELSGLNIKGRSIHTNKARFFQCSIDLPEIECKNDLEFCCSTFNINKIKAVSLSFLNYTKLEITEQMECENLFIRNVEHVVINVNNQLNTIKLENVKKVTLLSNLECSNLILFNSVISEDVLSKITISNTLSGNIKIEDCIAPEKLELRSKNQKLNTLSVINTPIQKIVNISGLALFCDQSLILENSNFDLTY